MDAPRRRGGAPALHDDAAGLQEYADAVADSLEALGAHEELVLVAHSFAGFTAPIVAARRPVDLLVLLNAMVPSAGESPSDWWAATGHAEATSSQDEGAGTDDFFHDLSPDYAHRRTGLGEDDARRGLPLFTSCSASCCVAPGDPVWAPVDIGRPRY